MYKHITDRRAQRRRYYQENQAAIRDASAQWYEDNKGTTEYMERKRNYMVLYRRRKKLGL